MCLSKQKEKETCGGGAPETKLGLDGTLKASACVCFLTDVDGLITQALLTGDFEGAVELCLHDNRLADSIILAIAGGPELLEKTQKNYFTKSHSKISKVTPGGAAVLIAS